MRRNIFILVVLSVQILSTIAAPAHDIIAAKQALVTFHQSGQFDQECAQVIDAALAYLNIHEPTFEASKTIVFDIDDTLLSNFEYVYKNDFGCCSQCARMSFIEWAQQGILPLISETKRLYDYCVQQGYHIVFISNRSDCCYDATLRNLALHGCTVFDQVILKPQSAAHIPAGLYKLEQRKSLTEQGFTIVACVGDQESDFVGGFTGHCIKIPNYFYRSWDYLPKQNE